MTATTPVTATSASMTPTPAMTIDQIEVDGAMVVVAEVEELSAAEKPCFMTAQGKERGTYMRLADGDHRLDTYSVFQLSVLTVPSEADREPVPEATIADLDTDLVDRTIARLKTNRGSEEGFDLGVLWVQGQREYRGLVPPTALFLEQSIPIGND